MWTPVSGSHSIERVRIVVALKQPLGQKKTRELLNAFERERTALGFEPVAETTGVGLAFQIGPAGIVPVADQGQNALSGWQAKRNRTPEFVAEALILNSSEGPQASATLTYENTEYSRWEVFCRRLERVWSSVVDDFMGHGDLATIFVEFYDRFNWNNSDKVGQPSDFLPALVSSLPPAAMVDGELWHLYRGWFENGRFGKLLVNQNFDCQDALINGQKVRSIQVLTRAEGRAGFWDLEDQPLIAHLAEMHDRTKQVFSDVLSEDMRMKIGITG